MWNNYLKMRGTARKFRTSYELDQWISYKPFDAAGVLRTTKNYVAPEKEFLFVKYEASEDDSLTVLAETLDPLSLEMTFSAIFTCKIGSSAKFFARAVNHDHEEFRTYEDTKTALLNGRTLRTKTNITSGPLPGLETFGDILANLQSGQQQEFVIDAEDCAWEILPDDGFELQPLKFGTKVGYWDIAYDSDSKRTELKNYRELLEAALAGRRVNFEILLGGCNGPESSAYFGGTIHDFYLEESEEMLLARITDERVYDNPSGAFLRSAPFIAAHEDDTVSIVIRAYLEDTWEDVFGGEARWTCYIN
ncbi:unnamed protein product [Notodromas monacha]|uniref:Uncharacterized protein n=1 Tax=Notodromas monacha TaxID=399045 RepID=A0A7R9BLR1_9CRUS|nr:unnamed protein product [Notodromas monacha]CAG0916468.1 unnamed protein product [Notodromas monacha]